MEFFASSPNPYRVLENPPETSYFTVLAVSGGVSWYSTPTPVVLSPDQRHQVSHPSPTPGPRGGPRLDVRGDARVPEWGFSMIVGEEERAGRKRTADQERPSTKRRPGRLPHPTRPTPTRVRTRRRLERDPCDVGRGPRTRLCFDGSPSRSRVFSRDNCLRRRSRRTHGPGRWGYPALTARTHTPRSPETGGPRTTGLSGSWVQWGLST